MTAREWIGDASWPGGCGARKSQRTVKDGKMSVPSGPGVGIKDLKGLLKGAVEVA